MSRKFCPDIYLQNIHSFTKSFFYANEADTPTARAKIKSRPNEIHKIEKSLKMMYCLTCIALTFGL